MHSTTDVLGKGHFGVVYRGEWIKPGEEKSVPVAVKTLKEGAKEEDKVKFLQEAAIIGQFSHPNVVKLHGIVTEEEVMDMDALSVSSCGFCLHCELCVVKWCIHTASR